MPMFPGEHNPATGRYAYLEYCPDCGRNLTPIDGYLELDECCVSAAEANEQEKARSDMQCFNKNVEILNMRIRARIKRAAENAAKKSGYPNLSVFVLDAIIEKAAAGGIEIVRFHPDDNKED